MGFTGDSGWGLGLVSSMIRLRPTRQLIAADRARPIASRSIPRRTACIVITRSFAGAVEFAGRDYWSIRWRIWISSAGSRSRAQGNRAARRGFDLRLLRRSMDFVASRIFDTVIAGAFAGIRAFIRGPGRALFRDHAAQGVAERTGPSAPAKHMAICHERHALPVAAAEKLEAECVSANGSNGFRQSCERHWSKRQSTRARRRGGWRISAGKWAGAPPRFAGLWQWRDKEAQTVDRPAFHILQTILLEAAQAFAAGGSPDYRHLSARRRPRFREAGERALRLPEIEWPIRPAEKGRGDASDDARRTVAAQAVPWRTSMARAFFCAARCAGRGAADESQSMA